MRLKNLKKWLLESRLRQVGFVILLVIIITIGSFLGWALTPLGPMEEALEALESDEHVIVIVEDRYIFKPVGNDFSTGFIIYPGARVDPRSYAPTAREIAKQGFLVIIEPMRLNLAVFSPDAASEAMKLYPEITKWAVGGHSLGGVMAARFAYNEGTDGLVLWASYPADDISRSDISSISIYGSRDGLTTVEDVEDRVDKMPHDTTWVKVEGGNHAQFGWYGDQRGDNEAYISREEQQKVIIDETSDFLSRL